MNQCFCCLKKGYVEVLPFPSLGAGSFFDGFASELHLCPECYRKFKEWFVGDYVTSGNYRRYRQEKELLAYLHCFPVWGQERFFNHYAYGYRCRYISAADWIKTHKQEIEEHQKEEPSAIIPETKVCDERLETMPEASEITEEIQPVAGEEPEKKAHKVHMDQNERLEQEFAKATQNFHSWGSEKKDGITKKKRMSVTDVEFGWRR